MADGRFHASKDELRGLVVQQSLEDDRAARSEDVGDDLGDSRSCQGACGACSCIRSWSRRAIAGNGKRPAPSGVFDVRLAAFDAFDFPGVARHGVDFGLLKSMIRLVPVNAGALHDHDSGLALGYPPRHLVEVASESSELLDLAAVLNAVEPENANDKLLLVDVQPGGDRVLDLKVVEIDPGVLRGLRRLLFGLLCRLSISAFANAAKASFSLSAAAFGAPALIAVLTFFSVSAASGFSGVFSTLILAASILSAVETALLAVSAFFAAFSSLAEAAAFAFHVVAAAAFSTVALATNFFSLVAFATRDSLLMRHLLMK